MAIISAFITLMRPYQYYKNVLIGICLVFSGNLFNTGLYLQIILGFITLSLLSSVGYVVNDIVDLEKDKLHPDKKFRPLASGFIDKKSAIIGAIIILTIAIIIGFSLSLQFLLVSSLVLVISLIYSFYMKNQPILDIIFVSINYVIRAVVGCILIDEIISPWLYICGFLFASFLVSGKRYGDLKHLGIEVAIKHRAVYQYYSHEFLQATVFITASSLLVSYAIYIIQLDSFEMLLTLPVFFYLVLRYLLIVVTSESGRKPHTVLFERNIIGSILTLATLVILSFY